MQKGAFCSLQNMPKCVSAGDPGPRWGSSQLGMGHLSLHLDSTTFGALIWGIASPNIFSRTVPEFQAPCRRFYLSPWVTNCQQQSGFYDCTHVSHIILRCSVRIGNISAYHINNILVTVLHYHRNRFSVSLWFKCKWQCK